MVFGRFRRSGNGDGNGDPISREKERQARETEDRPRFVSQAPGTTDVRVGIQAEQERQKRVAKEQQKLSLAFSGKKPTTVFRRDVQRVGGAARRVNRVVKAGPLLKSARSGASEFSMAAATEVKRYGNTKVVRRIARKRSPRTAGRAAGRTQIVFVGGGGQVVKPRRRKPRRRDQDIAGTGGGSLV